MQTDEHLVTVTRYAESNPLRAKMATDLGSWRWSSYTANAGLAVDALVTEAPVWAQLSANEEKRQAYWRHWLHTPHTEREPKRCANRWCRAGRSRRIGG
jgi:putative transposase